MDRRTFFHRATGLAAGIWAASAACGRSEANPASREAGEGPSGELGEPRGEAASGRAGGAPAAGRPLERIGVQLYTVRSLMARDVEGTLATVAEIGYREVEFAGYYQRTPADLRALIDGLGLTAPSAHYGIGVFRDALDETLDAAETLGHRYLVLPSLPREERETLDDYRRVADEMNGFAETCRARGVGFAYHNHAFEFERIDGRVPFDVLLEATDPALVEIELDLFWIREGGGDPFAYFDAYPGRFPLCHVKDRTPDGTMVEVGAGVIDFPAIFRRAADAGLAHYLVEHDQPEDPVSSIRSSFRHLSQLGL